MRMLVILMMLMMFGMGWMLKSQVDENKRSRELVFELAKSVDLLSQEVSTLKKEVVETKNVEKRVLEVVPEIEKRVSSVEEEQKRQLETVKMVEMKTVPVVDVLARTLQNKFGADKWFYMVNEAKIQSQAYSEVKARIKIVPEKGIERQEDIPKQQNLEDDVLRSRWVWQ